MGAIHSTKIQTGPTGKRGPVFSKLFRLDRTDPLSFGPKFPEIWLNGSRPVSHYYILVIHKFIDLMSLFRHSVWFSFSVKQFPSAGFGIYNI